jgi:hypothetical protein
MRALHTTDFKQGTVHPYTVVAGRGGPAVSARLAPFSRPRCYRRVYIYASVAPELNDDQGIGTRVATVTSHSNPIHRKDVT